MLKGKHVNESRIIKFCSQPTLIIWAPKSENFFRKSTGETSIPSEKLQKIIGMPKSENATSKGLVLKISSKTEKTWSLPENTRKSPAFSCWKTASAFRSFHGGNVVFMQIPRSFTFNRIPSVPNNDGINLTTSGLESWLRDSSPDIVGIWWGLSRTRPNSQF